MTVEKCCVMGISTVNAGQDAQESAHGCRNSGAGLEPSPTWSQRIGPQSPTHPACAGLSTAGSLRSYHVHVGKLYGQISE